MIYAVSDLHGSFDKFKRLLKEIRFTDNDVMYVIGDIVDMGDAPMETEEILLRDSALGLFEKRQVDLTSIEILKVAHHGSAYSTGEKFLSALGVKTAVISCGRDNLYNHPANATLQRLQDVNAEILRTDEQGHIIITIKSTGDYVVEQMQN